MSTFMIVSALMSGAVVGALLGLFGGGGSVLATPLLLYVVGIRDPHVAIGTSAAAVAVNAAINLLGHGRGGRVKWPCATVFAGAGLLGSFLGSSLAKAVDGQRLLLFFAVAMAAIALSMLRRPRSEGDPDVHITLPLMMKLAPLGVLTGLAAGFFGIGGGFLIVPGLMAATGMTLANAAASSLLSVAVFGAATSLNYAVSGQVDWPIAGLFNTGWSWRRRPGHPRRRPARRSRGPGPTPVRRPGATRRRLCRVASAGLIAARRRRGSPSTEPAARADG